MRWVAIVLSVISAVLLVLAFGSGGLAVMSRGGEDLIHFAGVCLWSALGLGLVSAVLAGLDVQNLKDQPGRGVAVFALFSAVGVVALGGGLKLFVFSINALGESEKKAEEKATLELQRPVDPEQAAHAIELTTTDLVDAWKREPAKVDARYQGQTLALTGEVMTSFLSGHRCAFPPGQGDIELCLTAAQADVNGPTTLVCRFGGIRNSYYDKRPGGDRLVLEGCAVR